MNPIRAAVAVALVAEIAVGGYLAMNSDVSPRPPQATPHPPLNQVNGLPKGATECPPVYPHLLLPFNAGARGTPTTSCAFVEQVRMEYAKQNTTASGSATLNVVSPATEMQYQLACQTTGSYATCAGGAAAVIYLYNKH